MSAAVAIPQTSEVAPQPVLVPSRDRNLVPYIVTALLMFGPVAFGAVEPWAIFVLQIAAVVLLALWAVTQVRAGQPAIISNPTFAPMCAFAGLILVQLAGTSAYRHATYSALLRYVAYGAVCFLVAQTLQRTTQIRRLGHALVVYGSCMAVFAVLESLSSGGKLYWIRTPRFGGWIYGPYVNHNHYAGLMEMLVPIPLVFAFSRYAKGRKRWLAAAAAAFMASTIFLSGSRGGMAAFAVQACLAVFYCLL
jgi:uncharacterized membrane protein